MSANGTGPANRSLYSAAFILARVASPRASTREIYISTKKKREREKEKGEKKTSGSIIRTRVRPAAFNKWHTVFARRNVFARVIVSTCFKKL